MRRKLFRLSALLLGLAGSPAAYAQRSFYRVYQYEQPLKGWLEATLWTTVVPSSRLDYEHFLNTSFYLGYIVPRQRYDNTQEVEVRTVLEHDFNDFRVVLNPTLSKAVSGEEARFWPTTRLDAGLYYRRYLHVQPGVELYNEFGELGPFRQPHYHQVFPTLDLRGLGFDLNLGLGLPLTAHNDDRLVVKALLVYSLGVVRPELLFHRGQRSTANQ